MEGVGNCHLTVTSTDDFEFVKKEKSLKKLVIFFGHVTYSVFETLLISAAGQRSD